MADLEAMIRQMFAGMSNGDLSVIDELVGDDYINHDMPMPEPGKAGLRNMAACRGVVTGTHQGEFAGIPATGKSVEVPWIDIWREADGKLVENWVRLDMLAMMTQLGVVPPPSKP